MYQRYEPESNLYLTLIIILQSRNYYPFLKMRTLKEYTEITKTMNETFESTNLPLVEVRERETLPLNIKTNIDFDIETIALMFNYTPVLYYEIESGEHK